MNETTAVVSAESLPIDTEGQQLRDSLQKAEETGQVTQESDETAQPEEQKAESSAKEGQQRTADAETVKQEATKPDSPEASAEEQKELSSYQKRRKELEESERRQADTWKRLDEGKLKWQTQLQQKIAQLEQRLAQQPQQSQQQQPRFSSQHLVQAADEFEAKAMKLLQEGDSESAQREIDLARKARQAAQESYFAEQKETYQSAYSQHEQTWRNTAAQVIQEHPELADGATDRAKAMQQLLQAEPLFGEIPDGFRRAYELLELRQKATEASGLKEKVVSLEKQLKELQERTGIKGSGPTPHTEPNIDDLPLDEQGQILRRQVMNSSYA